MTDINDWPGHPDADPDCECCLGDGLQADGETPCPCIDARKGSLAAQATPDQSRRAPIPADGRTIEAMRLALLDTPAGLAMINAGDTRLYWMNESDTYMPMSPFGIESPFINTTAPDAVARLVEAAKWVRDQSCEGFCRDLPRDDYYDKEMDMDCAGCRVRAALAAMEASHDRT